MSRTTTPTPLRDRVAGAPISWGVCEVPGWGHQLGPGHWCSSQMREVGLAATEFGPDGFLPDAPEAKARTLAAPGCAPSASSCPSCCTTPRHDPLPEVEPAMDGARRRAGVDGRDRRGHRRRGLRRAARARRRPVGDPPGQPRPDHATPRRRTASLATLHPHVGTMVETGEETDRVLAGQPHRALPRHRPPAHRRRRPRRASPSSTPSGSATCTSRTCASTSPRGCRRGELTYTEGVAQGMYVPAGRRATSTSPRSCGRSRAAATPGGTSSSRTPSSPGRPPTPGSTRVADVRASVAHILAVADALAVDPVSAASAARAATPEVVAMGRTGVDIYPLQHGVGLEDVSTFEKFLGGSADQRRRRRRPARPHACAWSPRDGRRPFGRYVRREAERLGVDPASISVLDAPGRRRR